MAILTILFKRILEMSLIASIAGLVILSVQKLLRKRLSPKWRNYLWIVFLLILINPISIKCPFSIYNIILTSSINQEEKKETLDKHTNQKGIYTFQNGIRLEQNLELNKEDEFITKIKKFYNQNLELLKNTTIISYYAILFCCLIKNLFVWINLLKNMNQPFENNHLKNMLEKMKKKLSISNEIQLIKQEIIKTPAIFGNKHPKIFLTESILSLSDEEIELIFLHELMHFKKKDIILHQFMMILKSIYWFNPILKILFHRIKHDIEMANDESVLEVLGPSNATIYCKTLLKVSQISKVNTTLVLGIGSSYKEMEERIRMITEKNKFLKKRGVLVTLVVTLVLGITVCFATSKIDNGEKEIKTEGKFIIENDPAALQEENKQEKEQVDNQQQIEVVYPLKEMKVTATYGKRIHPITKQEKSHDGIDLKANQGDVVMTIAGGVVEKTGFSSERGNYIIVRHEFEETLFSLYAHLSEIEIKVGDIVEAGDVIGKAGSTGMATGPHLHLSIFNENNETINPASILHLF